MKPDSSNSNSIRINNLPPVESRILFVSNDTVDSSFLSDILKAVPFDIDFVNTVPEALACLQKHRYRLLIADRLSAHVVESIDASMLLPAATPILMISESFKKHPLELQLQFALDWVLALVGAGKQHCDASQAGNPSAKLPGSMYGELSILDSSVLMTLAEDAGGIECLRELLSVFVAELKQSVAAIRNAFALRKFECLSRECHTLKSTCGSFGASRLQMLSYKFELACKDYDATLASDLFETLIPCSEETARAVEEFLQGI